MLIAEDLLLLLTDDEKGNISVPGYTAYLLAGAVLADLAGGGHIRITEKGEADVRPKRVVVDPQTPLPTDQLLLDHLQILAKKPSWRPPAVVQRFARQTLPKAVYDRLVVGEFVHRDARRALGIIPYQRYPAVPGEYEAKLRRTIDVALLEGGDADFHTAALIALLSAGTGTLRVLKQGRDLDWREVKRRAKVLREQYWAAKAAYDAIQETAAAGAAAGA